MACRRVHAPDKPLSKPPPYEKPTSDRRPAAPLFTLPHLGAVSSPLDTHPDTANAWLLWAESGRQKTDREENEQALM